MSKDKIWLSSPHMGGEEIKYIQEAFDSNWVAPLGPNVNEFENLIEHYLGDNVHVAALSSGTAAIHLALILLGVKRGDDVICQSFTFAASANPIIYQGANPIFVDSEIDTWNMCPKLLEECIIDRISSGEKPKAIIAVHLYGMPFKADEILKVAQKYDIPVIEDSAEALGSSYKGKKCGLFGDISVLSFNGNKIITTSGGGALVSMNKQIVKKSIFLATQARDDAPHYEHSELGFNYRMSNICAGIGRGQMSVLDNHVHNRRTINNFYQKIFRNAKGVKLHNEYTTDYFSNFWLSTILVNESEAGFSANDLRLELGRYNIESRPLWKPMHLQPLYSKSKSYLNGISEKLFERGLCLPSGSNLTNNELKRIESVIFGFMNS